MLKKMRSLLTVALLTIATIVSAQVTTSSISGKVTAQDEPAIGATVIAIHESSGTRYGAVTNVNGQFTIQGMRAGGPYKIDISYIGFQPAIYKEIYLSLGENPILNVTLKESAELLDEIVIIGSSNSNMKSNRAGAVMNANRDMIIATPTVSRSMNDVMRLSPQGADVGNGFAVGGGNYRQSFVTVDGASFNNTFGIGANLPANGSPISLDALEEISVSVTPYDVRQSGFTGGGINAVTRSGDNQFRGTAYTYFSNNNMKGNKVGDYEMVRTDAHVNTYGLSLGGPLIKDKLFFFVNGEYEDSSVAGPTAKPRANDSQDYSKGDYYRPLQTDLDEMRQYLITKYGYDPGRYNDYTKKTPGYRLMGRLDWNVNENNKVSLRISQTRTQDSNAPSTSVSPLTAGTIYPGNTSLGVPASQNRTSRYSMYFENSRYYQERNFSSIAAEWNARFLDGKLNNMMRFAYSYQDEPRRYDGGAFPTVDILKDGAPYMSLGTEIFTEGNLRKTSVWSLTDEVNWNIGIHKLMGGLQYEFTNAINGYMQGGTGYYVYSSMDDFKNGGNPAAFAITHPSVAGSPYEAKMDYKQFSAYMQDEISLSDNLRLTAGIRFEVPMYPSLKDNYNDAFAKLDFGGNHYTTDQLPSTKVTVSPRVGFNWDITGERKYVLRGGTGVFVGRMPFVWLVSTMGNSNVGQKQYFYNKSSAAGAQPSFHANLNDILTDLYNNGYSPDQKPPQSPTVISKDLKMPSTWKTSLAFDVKLPYDIDLTLEGIYNKDYNPAVVTNYGYKPASEDSKITLSPQDSRYKYTMYSDKTWANENQNAYMIENGKKGAYYYSISAQLRKKFNFGLDLSFAYTHSKSRSYGDGIGDQVSSAIKTNTYSVNGNNEHELGYGTYVAPDRIIATISYKKEYAKYFATSVSLLYEGMQMGFAGNFSYARYSYTFGSNIVGDYGANNLIYIPGSREELDSWKFADINANPDKGIEAYSATSQKDDFWAYINQDSYLKNHKGQYAERGGALMPWHHQFDFKLNQDFYFNVCGKRNTLQLGLDIKNVGNLLNSNWGLYKQVINSSVLGYNTTTGVISMNKSSGKVLKETYQDYQGYSSTYSMQVSLRYIF